MKNPSREEIQMLKSVRHQIKLTEKLLRSHPLLSDRLKMLQAVLRLFRMQTEWAEAGSMSRFLITLNTALIGMSTEESQMGLFGPRLMQLNRGLQLLFEGSLPLSNGQLPVLLTSLLNVVCIGLVFYLSQTLGNWRERFPLDDIPQAKKAGLFLKELGLSFILGSQMLESFFRALVKHLDIDPREKKFLDKIGMAYLLLMIFLMHESEQRPTDEFGELLLPALYRTIDPLMAVVQAVDERGLLETSLTNAALGQLQLIQRAILELDVAELRSIFISSCEVFGCPFEELRKECKSLIDKCSQISMSLENALTEAKQPQTEVMQSA